MNRTWATAILLALLVVCALALRLPKLDLRPMHTDEAVQADKSGTLLETGRYVYNPHEFHGPALHYLTLPSMWLSGGKYTDCSETTLRVVPALMGGLLLALLWLLRDGLGASGMLCAAALLACSPSMVFYNRYYIAETPLIFGNLLAIGCVWRYLQAPSFRWAALAGLGLGLMYTTKETWVFNVAAAAGALALLYLAARRADRTRMPLKEFIQWQPLTRKHAACALAVFAVVGVLLFTAFFTNLRGPLDSVGTYVAWGKRALNGKGYRLDDEALASLRKAEVPAAVLAKLDPLKDALFESRDQFVGRLAESLDARELDRHQSVVLKSAAVPGPHDHPWYYFLKLLTYNMNLDPGQFVWKFFFSEALILLLALVGACVGFSGWNPAGTHVGFIRFVTLYTILLAAIYSVIPYKTPWCMLGFHLGFILLGGVGAASIVAGLLSLRPKFVAGVLAGLAGVLLLAGLSHLCLQTCRANFDPVLVAHRRNPYVYAHTNTDALRLASRIQELALLSPQGRNAVVLVAAPGNDYWPLPYYLRGLKRKGFADRFPDGWRKLDPVVVAYLDDPESKERIRPPEGYVPAGFFGLRPTVNFVVLTQPKIWEAFQEKAKNATPPAK